MPFIETEIKGLWVLDLETMSFGFASLANPQVVKQDDILDLDCTAPKDKGVAIAAIRQYHQKDAGGFRDLGGAYWRQIPDKKFADGFRVEVISDYSPSTYCYREHTDGKLWQVSLHGHSAADQDRWGIETGKLCPGYDKRYRPSPAWLAWLVHNPAKGIMFELDDAARWYLKRERTLAATSSVKERLATRARWIAEHGEYPGCQRQYTHQPARSFSFRD